MVGPSGRNHDRCEPVTARIRIVPSLANAMLSLIGLMLADTWPPTRSCNAGGLPRECTAVMGMPASFASITPTKWGVPPAAVVPYDALAGFALHHAMKSASVVTLSGSPAPTL